MVENGTIIIALVSAAGIIVTLILNLRTNSLTTKANFMQLFHQYSMAHTQLLKDEGKLKDEQDSEIHAIAYFDLLDRLAYLLLEKRIEYTLGETFREYFAYVQIMMQWYDETVRGNTAKISSERWPHIINWCKIENIQADKVRSYLPDKMIEIWNTYEQEKNKHS